MLSLPHLMTALMLNTRMISRICWLLRFGESRRAYKSSQPRCLLVPRPYLTQLRDLAKVLFSTTPEKHPHWSSFRRGRGTILM